MPLKPRVYKWRDQRFGLCWVMQAPNGTMGYYQKWEQALNAALAWQPGFTGT